ncbi:MAG: adenylate/guanylate cyclase domain-containing protein [Rhodothermales bacterium]|nr:adenylate/guanylate cyclase domain-containing protein [Rhodothermales bacterium]
MSNRLQRKLAAILYADVAGYSRLTGEDEEGTHRLLGSYLDALTAIIEAYNGKVLHYAGDAVLADFATASEALVCAAAMQRDLGVRNRELPEDRQLRFRIGVNLGEVIVDRGEIYGDGVNVAARLESLAEPGGICISGTVYDALGVTLPFEYQPLGEKQVKNIAKPIRAYRAELPPGTDLPPPSVSAAAIPRRRRFAANLVALVVTLSAVTILAIWIYTSMQADRPGTEGTSVISEKPSVAVLPFTNLSNDPEQEYFSDGITNDIITDLSKFGSLLVIASNSVFAYKNTPVKVQQVSRELDVRYIVEGSVQKGNDRIRVNAQLIDAKTGHHVWAERYERDLRDLFAVQDEIVRSIVGALAVKVREAERERAMRKNTENMEAYDYYLRGREYLSHIDRSSNLRARELFEKAIDLDVRYSAAYVGIGWTYRTAVGHGWTEFVDQALQKAHDFAQTALRLEDVADAHGLLGSIYLARGEYELARDALERAIDLNPNDADSLSVLGAVMLYTGNTAEAVRVYERVMRFDPNANADTLYDLGLAYFLLGQYANSIKTLERGKSRNPALPFIRAALAAAYAEAGRVEEAQREAASTLRLHPFFDLASFGSKFVDPKDRERIVNALRKAGIGSNGTLRRAPRGVN